MVRPRRYFEPVSSSSSSNWLLSEKGWDFQQSKETKNNKQGYQMHEIETLYSYPFSFASYIYSTIKGKGKNEEL
jgi:glutathionyl-hydroquinone reductase